MPITIDGTGTITGISVGGLPDGSVNNADLATDAVSTSKILNGAVTTAKMGSNEQAGLAKAWVNFNGTGTVAIRANYNVSSITDNGVGDYTVNFTTAMPDANYSVTTCQGDGTTLAAIPYLMNLSPGGYGKTVSITTSSIRLYATNYNNGTYDAIYNYVAIFR